MSGSVKCGAVLAAGLILAAARAPAAAPPASDAAKARAAAIKATLDGIDDDLQKYGGGSWQKWGEANKAFRQAVAKLLTAGAPKWPWPAKNGFVFQGSAVKLLLLDTLDGQPDGERPFDAVAAFDKQLKARGIDLIFVPLPDKVCIYGDWLRIAADSPPKAPLCTAAKHLMKRLLEADVECVDVYTPFLAYRAEHGDDKPLYYDRDSHWRNVAARIAAGKIAERLKRYDFVAKALAGGNRYSTKPELRRDKPDDIEVVLDARGGRYRDDAGSPILIMGDSNLMYNMGPTGGHMPAHVGRHIGMPLTFVCPTFGDAPGRIRNQLDGKKVIVWAQIGRTLIGKWPTIDLGAPPAARPDKDRNNELPAEVRKLLSNAAAGKDKR